MSVFASQTGAEERGFSWDVRYRLEVVDDDAFVHDAEAHTLRLRMGYLWAPADGWTVFAEGEHVEAFGNDHDSTANGRTAFPVVADPGATEVNQAWAAWRGARTRVSAGRQRIVLGGQRFVGNVGWRQNEQTYDAVRIEWTREDGAGFHYAWLDRVHRVFGDQALNPLSRERRHDSHLFDLSVSTRVGQTLTAYLYLLDDRDLPVDSSATAGVRWMGRSVPGNVVTGWTLEAARQRAYGGQPAEFSLGYTRVEPYLETSGVKLWLGWERLQGNGRRGFSTPLATLHAYNGWADRFLTTPPGGLDDRYLGMSGEAGRADWTVVWHHFSATHDGTGYGTEWNGSVGMPLPGEMPGKVLVKFADHRGDGPTDDVRKVWIQLSW